MEPVRMRLDWSSLPTDLLFQIISRDKDDFKQRLAVMGVCRHWRDCCGRLDRLVIRKDLLYIPCEKHGGCNCSCLEDSITSVLNRSKSVLKKLTLTIGYHFNVLHRNWAVQDGLDSLSLIFYNHWLLRLELDESRQLVHSTIANILIGQTGLRRFKLFFFKRSREYSFSFQHVNHLRSLTKLHFLNVFKKLSELNSFIQMLPNLQVVEFRNSSIELDEQVLRFEGTRISVLRLGLPDYADVEVDAPNLRELELYGFEGIIRTQGGCLHKLVLGAPVIVELTTAREERPLEDLCITPAYDGDLVTIRYTISLFPSIKTLRLLLWDCARDWENADDWEHIDNTMFVLHEQLQELETSDFFLMHLCRLVWTSIQESVDSFVETFCLGNRLRTLTVTLLSDFSLSGRFDDKAACVQAIRAFVWDNELAGEMGMDEQMLYNVNQVPVPQLAIRLRGLESEVQLFLVDFGVETGRKLVHVKKEHWYVGLFEETEMFEVDVDLVDRD